jgi:hypothetical protein
MARAAGKGLDPRRKMNSCRELVMAKQPVRCDRVKYDGTEKKK